MFIMVSFSGDIYKNDLRNVNERPASNNYTKIGNITFMHNFIIKNNGEILSGNINRSIVNNINNNYNKDINTSSNNNLTPISYNYKKTNNTNYLLEKYNLTSKNDILYTIAFTDNFTKYRVEIGDIIINKDNKNISEIYANIVPKNSSKILYGNEFTINHTSSYNNQMKNLINSLYLLSMYYMSSNNITMHKFGIENNYISMAMNTMLGKTNNTIKSMNVSETNAIVMDYTFNCILSIITIILIFLGISLMIAAFSIATAGIGDAIVIGTSIAAGGVFLAGWTVAIASLAIATYFTGNSCFGGW